MACAFVLHLLSSAALDDAHMEPSASFQSVSNRDKWDLYANILSLPTPLVPWRKVRDDDKRFDMQIVVSQPFLQHLRGQLFAPVLCVTATSPLPDNASSLTQKVSARQDDRARCGFSCIVGVSALRVT